VAAVVQAASVTRAAATADETFEQYLLRLTDLEVGARASNAVQACVCQAGFPVPKDFESFDLAAAPSLSKRKVLELVRGEWIEQRSNVCLMFQASAGRRRCWTG
jgi:DNA replication protein DnaC